MTTSTLTKDVEFYIADQLCVVAVETTLFKVHRSMLVQYSEVFKGMFVDGLPAFSNGDGASDKNPIVLKSITAFDFRSFLKIIYRSADAGFTLTPEWLAVLCVAHRYQCPGIHARALDYLQGGFKPSSRSPSRRKGEWGPEPGAATLSDAVRILGAAESRGISVNYFNQGALCDAVLRIASLSKLEFELVSSQLAAQLTHARELKHYLISPNTVDKADTSFQHYNHQYSRTLWPKLGNEDPHFSLFEPMTP
ncbi:unnamed protein product [Peniophora sp. CBMAI 1063]|nr:unnamed protein product [Peniophora sp. CBMAI 1063]